MKNPACKGGVLHLDNWFLTNPGGGGRARSVCPCDRKRGGGQPDTEERDEKQTPHESTATDERNEWFDAKRGGNPQSCWVFESERQEAQLQHLGSECLCAPTGDDA
jgi:hypothetical protein